MLDAKYRIDRLLAVGGMGAVYVGTHIQLRKRVAIKILNPQLSSAAMIERFHREAITASQIGHEGIAQVTDLGTSGDGEPFLVMEYLEGESLASRLRASGPLPVEDACEIGCAILSPLDAAHRAGIVHRDLKPDNVYLVRQSRGEMVKLLDFGISRAAGLESEFRLTTTGLVLGTPYYMSPEQARGDIDVSPAADLYAFGVMLYEMLIGHVPIQAENYNQLMYRVMTGDYPRPRELRADLPEPLELIILQAMALEPNHRPPSAAELERALLGFCRPAMRGTTGSLSSPALPRHLPTGQSAPMRPGPTPGPTPSGQSGLLGQPAASQSGPQHHQLGQSDEAAIAHASTMTGPTLPSGAPVAIPTAPRRSKAIWFAALAVVIVGGIGAAVAVTSGDDGQARSLSPTASSTASPTSPTAPSAPAASTTGAPTTASSGTPPAGSPSTAATTPSTAAPTTAEAPPSSTPAASTEPSTTTPDNSNGSTAPTSAPMTITLRFAVDPTNAIILVDGKRIRGSELDVTRDTAQHTLHITAPGRLPHDETIRFDENQRIFVQLFRAGQGSKPGREGKDTGRKDRGNDERIDSESPYH